MKRALAFGVLAAAATLAASCGKCEPFYAGVATDEAWIEMIDTYDSATAPSTCAAPDVTTPAEGAVLAGTRIEWSSDCLAMAPAAAPGATPARLAVRAGCSRDGLLARWADALADLVSARADAHLPPITGPIYYVEIPVPGDRCGALALTTDEFWELDADTLALLRGAGTLSITITGAYLTENNVTEGPYRAATPRTFSVE
jgi:hypothetical protein